MARLVRAIQEISGYRGQAAVRRRLRMIDKMKCQQTLVRIATPKIRSSAERKAPLTHITFQNAGIVDCGRAQDNYAMLFFRLHL